MLPPIGINWQLLPLIMAMTELEVCPENLELYSDHFFGCFCRSGGFNEDLTLWPNGARLPLINQIKYSTS
jgi:hypothetical protein